MRPMSEKKNPHAVALGKLGGAVSSPAKRKAVRENGRQNKPQLPLKTIAGVAVHHEAELAATVRGRPVFLGTTPAARKWLERHPEIKTQNRKRGPIPKKKTP